MKKFKSVNGGLSRSYDWKQNTQLFLNKIKKQNNLSTFEDWNAITQKQVRENGGGTLLKKYSMYDLKCMGFPDGKLQFNKSIKPKEPGYWDNKSNILEFLGKLQKKYNLTSVHDWNSISRKHIQDNGGGALLKQYSMYDLKCFGYPDGKFIFEKSKPYKPSGYWDNKNNIYKFIEELKVKYNLKTPDDWNLITRKQIQENGGRTLCQKYSMYEIKCMACPEGKFIFQKPIDYWNDESNRNRFIEKLKLKYNLKTPQDWKRVSFHQIKLLGGDWLLSNNMEFLKSTKISFEIQDSENENITKIQRFSLRELIQSDFKRSSQRWLFLQVQKLFPGEEIVEDYFHSEISRESGFSVQFDIFLINRNIAIEYHGQQHYEDMSAVFASLEMHKTRDLEKKKLCEKYGIQLIVIPYWWDNNLESLKKTLQESIDNEELKTKLNCTINN